MSVQSELAKTSYTLAAPTPITAPMEVPFYFLEESHLKVILIKASTGIAYTLALTTSYTVVGAGLESGLRTVTLTGATVSGITPAYGDIVTITRNVPLSQTVDYVPNAAFPATTHERALDKLTMAAQQIKSQADTALRLEEGEDPLGAAVQSTVLGLAARKGNLLGFNSTTGAVEFTPTAGTSIQAAADYASDAAASASDAAGYASDAASDAAIINALSPGLPGGLARLPAQAPMFKFWKKLFEMRTGNVRQLVLCPTGDSVAPLTFDRYINRLAGLLGVAGNISTYGLNVALSGGGGTANGTTIAYDTSISPTGVFHRVNASGSVTFGLNATNGVYADTIKIPIIIEPGAGNYTIETAVDGGSFSAEASYTNQSAAGTLGLQVITLSKTAGTWRVRVTWVSGTVRFLEPFMVNSAQSGVVVYPMHRGGLALSEMVGTNSTIYAALLGMVAPDMIHFEMQDMSAQSTGAQWSANLATLLSRVSAVRPICDWIFCSSNPRSTDDANNVEQNNLTREFARSNGLFFFDQYNIIGSYANLVAIGQNGDGTHRGDGASQYLAGVLWTTAFSILDSLYSGSQRSIVPDQATSSYTNSPNVVVENVSGEPALTFYVPSGTGEFWGVRFLQKAANNRGVLIQVADAYKSIGRHTWATAIELASATGYAGAGNAAVALGGKTPNGAGVLQMPTNGSTLLSNGIAWSSGQGIRRDGTSGALQFLVSSDGSVADFTGTGTPEGVVTAGVGSTFRRTNGSAGTLYYLKETGTGNTGWVAKW